MNKIKIAYFIKDLSVPSQTFVRSLVNSLSQECVVKVFDLKEENAVRIFYNRACSKISRIKSAILSGSNLFEFQFILSYGKLKNNFTRHLKKVKEFSPDIYYADFGQTGLIVAEEAIKQKKPAIIHFHGNDASQQLKCENYVRHLKIILSNPLVSIIVPSDHLGRMLQIACGSTLDYKKIPYGPEIVDFNRASGIDDGQCHLIFVGRLVPKKNPLALIEAFRIATDQKDNLILDIVGDGPLMPDVRKRIEQLGLGKKINLHGRKSHDFCLALMARADLYVQHSVTDFNGDQEGLPNSILEALLLGKPVISTIHSGIPEAVEDGRNGYLVREHDFVQMGEKIVQALGRSKESWVFDREKEYTPEARVAKVMKLIKRVNG
jgi:glycosyltransferase involved in cell wall biosynthesis